MEVILVQVRHLCKPLLEPRRSSSTGVCGRGPSGSLLHGSQKVSTKGPRKRHGHTQISSGIHRVLVLMPVCTCIRAPREKGKPGVRRGARHNKSFLCMGGSGRREEQDVR